jgi:hypothetical protein
MRYIISEMFTFIPTSIVHYKHLSLSKFTSILFLSILSSIVLTIIVWCLFKLTNMSMPINLGQSNLRASGSLRHFIVVCILAPLFEECGHRLWLRYSALNLSISIPVILYFLFNNILHQPSYSIESKYLYKFFILIIFGFFLYKILSSKYKINLYLKNTWDRNPKYIFWISVLSFSLWHIVNFKVNYMIILLAPILTLPQMFIGIILYNVRLKYGFIYGILIHAMHNAFPIVLYVISKYISLKTV